MTLKNGVCSVTFDCRWIASSMAMVSIVFETLPSVSGWSCHLRAGTHGVAGQRRLPALRHRD